MEALYLKNRIWELSNAKRVESEAEIEAPTLYIDNQSAIKVMHQDGFNARTKHIETDRDTLWVKLEVEKGRLQLEYINTHHQLADFLTKPLQHHLLNNLLDKIGMRRLNSDNNLVTMKSKRNTDCFIGGER
jgi:hypothetical protein